MNRRELIEKRKRISNRQAKEKAIAGRLLPFLMETKMIAAYYPINGEADIYTFLKTQPELAGKIILLPKTYLDHMEFFEDQNLQPGYMGIPEPADGTIPVAPDLILVPLVAFSDTNRLGYGKGCYDRYLKDFKGVTIGIAFEEQQYDFPVQPWDVPLDFVLTPKRLISKKTS